MHHGGIRIQADSTRIACPEHHIWLRPATVRQCAWRPIYDLAHNAAPNWWTYSRLLDVAETFLARLRPLGAVDFFDVLLVMRVIVAV